MTYQVLDIANKVIASIDGSKGETISNLKLQKLLYYLQGFFIAIYDRKIFDDSIEAWQYGPVVKSVYEHFKTFGASALTLSENQEVISLATPEEEALFNEILEEFGQFSAIKLMNMTHEELPWKKIFSEDPQGEISYDLLKEYFKTQIIN
jgi:uncharacterized phage-associated protein